MGKIELKMLNKISGRYALCAMGFTDRREGKMATKGFLLIGLVGIFLISVSCAGPTRLEMDYGTSYKLAKFNQILDPAAEKNCTPVTGLDGRAAQGMVEKYRKGFEEKAPPPPLTLSIGAGSK